MLSCQKETYGDGLDQQFLHPYMWAWKGHYYRPGMSFYNYPYAFGLLFGLGLFSVYQSGGNDFLESYTVTPSFLVDTFAPKFISSPAGAVILLLSLSVICLTLLITVFPYLCNNQ